MSLLLEALKKAEKAKEEAQRRARGDAGEAPAPAEADNAAEPAKPVLTRDKLPEITSQPLEILEDDLPPKEAVPAPLEAPPPSDARVEPKLHGAPAAQEAASRASARKVFEAKFREPNPRLPFYLTLGALGAFAIGTVVYFWYQLRPPAPLVNLNPARPANEAPVQVAAAPAPQAQAATPAAAATAPAIPGLPPAPSPAAREQSAPAPAATARPAPPPAELRPKPAPAPRVAQAVPERPRLSPPPEAPRLAPPEPRVAPAPRPLVQVNPKVESAYAAFLAGDLVAARADYGLVLQEDPANRDAHLGLAALDVKAGRYEAAEATYLRLLQSDPRDAEAQAALIALRGGRLDPLIAESRLKSLLAADPGAHVLNFTLGNQLAQQGRWSEAQQEYFRAFSAEPDNPDFAYNLAVSLDHIRQPRLALEYYKRAIALSGKRGASFDLAAARERVSQLEK